MRAKLILAILMSGGIYYLLSYYLSLSNQKKEWFRTEFVEIEYKGIVKQIGDYSYNSEYQKEYVNITIVTTDTLEPEIHYGMLSYKEEPLLKTFLAKGDSIYKEKGEKEVTIKKPDGKIRRIKLPFNNED